MVRDSSLTFQIDYIIVMLSFLNPKGHQNRISGSKVTVILLKGLILPIGEASAGEGLRLQPAQQACLYVQASGLFSVGCLNIFNLGDESRIKRTS